MEARQRRDAERERAAAKAAKIEEEKRAAEAVELERHRLRVKRAHDRAAELGLAIRRPGWTSDETLMELIAPSADHWSLPSRILERQAREAVTRVAHQGGAWFTVPGASGKLPLIENALDDLAIRHRAVGTP